MKTCNQCLKYKPLKDFYPTKPSCKLCHNEPIIKIEKGAEYKDYIKQHKMEEQYRKLQRYK